MSDAAERDWRKPAITSPQEDSKSKLPLFVAALLGAALLGVLVWAITAPERNRPTRLIFVPLVNNTAWPAAPSADGDFKLLVKHFADRDDGATRKSLNAANLEAGNYQDFIDNQIPKMDPDQPVVLYVAGTAVVWKDQVYLLSNSTKGTQAEITSQPLDRVIKAFDACPAKKKILVLDVARRAAGPRRGIYCDRAAAAIDQLFNARKERGMVLVSTGPGEFSQPMDEGSTGFAHYLDRGLCGEADIDGNGLMASELATFVCNRVAYWSKEGRGESQNPKAYGNTTENDFQLATPFFYKQRAPKPPPPPTTEEKEKAAEAGRPKPAFPTWLRDQWALRDEWEGVAAKLPPPDPKAPKPAVPPPPPVARREPLNDAVARLLEQRLLVAQAEWEYGAGGSDASKWFSPEFIERRRFGIERGKPRADVSRSLADSDDEKALAALAAPFNTWFAERTRTAMPVNKSFLAWAKEALLGQEVQPTEKLVLALVWKKLGTDAVPLQQVKLLLDEVEPLCKYEGDAKYGESIFLRLIQDRLLPPPPESNPKKQNLFESNERQWIGVSGRTLPGSAFFHGVRAETALAAVRAALIPATYERFSAEFASLLAIRTTAEAMLLRCGEPNELAYSDQAAAAQEGYKKLASDAEKLRAEASAAHAAHAQMIEGFAELPGYVEWIARSAAGDAANALKHWMSAAGTTSELADDFARGTGSAPSFAERTAALREDLAWLRAAFEEQTAPWRMSLADRQAATNIDPLELQRARALLASPRLRAGDRAEVWARLRTILAEKLAIVQSIERSLTGAPAGGGPSAAANPKTLASLALGLARLSGVEATTLRPLESTAASDPTPQGWDELAQELLPWVTPTEAIATDGTVGAPRWSRVFGKPVARDGLSEPGQPELKKFRAWLAERYYEEGTVRGLHERPFYISIVNAYRN